MVQRKRGAGGHSKLAHGPVADQHDNLQENPSSKQSRKAPKSAMDLPQTKVKVGTNEENSDEKDGKFRCQISEKSL